MGLGVCLRGLWWRLLYRYPGVERLVMVGPPRRLALLDKVGGGEAGEAAEAPPG